MIAINALQFDPAGQVKFKPGADSELRGLTRRTNRVATLDGGVAVNDRGFADGDRTFKVTVPNDKTVHDGLSRMLRLYPRVRVCTSEGAFNAAIEAFDPRRSLLTLLVIERTSE